MRAAAALAVLLAAPGRAAAADAEAAKDAASPVQTYYQEALDYYAKGDLRRAIGKWNEVLRVDASQKTAQAMVLQARRRIEVLTEKRRKRTFELIGAGRYEEARLELQALLDQDPGHPQVEGLQSRLDDVEKVAKVLEPKDKPTRIAVLGLRGFLVYPQDLRLAYDALRYAIELDGNGARFQPFLDLVLDEKPDLAEDAVTPGMKLMPYLQMVAVHDIYDGKYHRAVARLNEILTLEPGDALALKRLGSAYYSLGEKKRARDAWTRALRLQPDDRTLRKFLAKVGGEAPEAKPAGAKAPPPSAEEPADPAQQP